MSASNVPQKHGAVKVSTEEREKRIAAFRQFSEADLARCRQQVYKRVSPTFWDPEDALSGALEIAVTRYTGLGDVSRFVAACALNYARRERRHHKAVPNYAHDLPDEDEDTTQEHSLVFASYDPEPIEGIDPQLIKRVDQIVDIITKDKTHPRKSHICRGKVNQLAHTILPELAAAADNGSGLGVSEYDDAPLRAKDWQGQTYQRGNIKIPRQQILKHIVERYDAHPANARYAINVLKKGLQRAIYERDGFYKTAQFSKKSDDLQYKKQIEGSIL